MSLPRREDWSGLLGRPAVTVNAALASRAAAGRRVLVTGAGGSIGVELVRALAQAPHRGLVLLDASEQACYELEAEFHALTEAGRAEIVLGNAGDPALLRRLFAGGSPAFDLVLHAAAYKQVPLLQRDPFAAVANNILVTARLLEAFMAAPAGNMPGGEPNGTGGTGRRFVLVSTDKAADPASVMGATKRIAELLVMGQAGSVVQAIAVRLGNVLGSHGSVVPLFRKQITQRQPLTVTHPGVRRFFMTPEEAVNALLEAAACKCDGLVAADLVAGPGAAIPVVELARYLLRQAARPEDGIVYTGLRAGDKLEEVFADSTEHLGEVVPGTRLRQIISPAAGTQELAGLLNALHQAFESGSREHLLAALAQVMPATNLPLPGSVPAMEQVR